MVFFGCFPLCYFPLFYWQILCVCVCVCVCAVLLLSGALGRLALVALYIWATSWQINKLACAPCRRRSTWVSAQLIRFIAVRMKKALVMGHQMNTQQRLIRLGGCPSWSESSLGAHRRTCHLVGFVMRRLVFFLKSFLGMFIQNKAEGKRRCHSRLYLSVFICMLKVM